jgi:hypothetical protein
VRSDSQSAASAQGAVGRRSRLARTTTAGVVAQVQSPWMQSDARANDRAERQAHLRRWEAVEAFKAQELAAMTDARAREIIQTLGAVEGWRERADWSGLVEQQAIFGRARRR